MNRKIKLFIGIILMSAILGTTAYAAMGISGFGMTGVSVGEWVDIANPKTHPSNRNYAYINVTYVDNNSRGPVALYMRSQLTAEIVTDSLYVYGSPVLGNPTYHGDYSLKTMFLCAYRYGANPVTIAGEWDA